MVTIKSYFENILKTSVTSIHPKWQKLIPFLVYFTVVKEDNLLYNTHSMYSVKSKCAQTVARPKAEF